MKTIAIRYSDKIAPQNGTLFEHAQLIHQNGFVWFGKMGTPVSDKTCKSVMAARKPHILLINNGKKLYHWAIIDKIQKDTPPLDYVPSYYRNKAEVIGTWFKILKFEKAETDILTKCTMSAYGATLLTVFSRKSMNSYFVINYDNPDWG